MSGCIEDAGSGLPFVQYRLVTLSRGLRQLTCAWRVCASLRVFPPNVWGLATLTKLNTELRICRTKFCIVTLIFCIYE